MGFNNPAMPWSELERRLSGGSGRSGPGHPHAVPLGDGGDSPAWSRQRPDFDGAGVRRVPGAVPYAELHSHSHFSFLDGASSPGELATEAARLGLEAMALTDHGGFYGVVRFAEAAREVGLPTVFGTELTLDAWQPVDDRTADPSRTGAPDPAGRHVVVLARGPEGYASLAALTSTAQMAGEKGAPRLSTAAFLESTAQHRGQWAVLTGGRKGLVAGPLVN